MPADLAPALSVRADQTATSWQSSGGGGQQPWNFRRLQEAGRVRR